uniref:Uncharacterized protein n=1 Tax=Myoviridae sp. ctijX18 TaxID=2825154 RepID=A0A8S5USP8_9CAUD|nr:MAG TPA: hypothetical protein [Myoviridae sp. ctijX18]DAJ69056.1 MAG TPA: hypothetical protein [Caudoviricetes sp.]DAR99726.1 MAG TPA: hypothetical protein [Caudoviricetes sp.]DAY25356.1 MAG TPA: hypothetical protein [Caudoviricetes sp.]
MCLPFVRLAVRVIYRSDSRVVLETLIPLETCFLL